MRPTLIPAVALALLTFCSPNRDRQNRETGMGRETAGGLSSNDTIANAERDSTAPPGNATPTPAAILSQLNVANTTEIQLAGLAAKKATSAQVKQVAKRLATDHTKNEEQLKALAQKLNLNLTPAEGGTVGAADSTALPPDLQGQSGSGFDKAFIRHEIEEHQANINKIKTQMLPAAQNEEVKAYLQKTVTDMEAHLAVLKRAQQQIGA
jgi:putative membrane protein